MNMMELKKLIAIALLSERVNANDHFRVNRYRANSDNVVLRKEQGNEVSNKLL